MIIDQFYEKRVNIRDVIIFRLHEELTTNTIKDERSDIIIGKIMALKFKGSAPNDFIDDYLEIEQCQETGTLFPFQNYQKTCILKLSDILDFHYYNRSLPLGFYIESLKLL